MPSALAAQIGARFAPSAWRIVEDGEVLGLGSPARAPADATPHIGYGIAPSRQRADAATRAIATLAAWPRSDPRAARITADTGADNLASQRVLERNGFRRSGERIDPEDGPLVCWPLPLA